MRLRFSTFVLALLAGCSSGPEPAELSANPTPVGQDCSLTVIVWSSHLQRAVPAQGVVMALDSGDRLGLDTRSSVSSGQTLSGLQPGRYRISVTVRHVRTGKHPVKGEQDIYLEPGMRSSATVVAVDRKDDIGLADEDTLPASAPHLPLEQEQG